MRILIVGSGGREHALAWKCAQSAEVEDVLVAPGNAGTARERRVQNRDVAADDIRGLIRLANREQVDLTIVGPEAPLVAGIVDAFNDAGLPCFGPTAAAARLEGSKAYAKDFLARHGIPTAAYATFSEIGPALAYIRERQAPIVIKADGLAAGKGVIVARTLEEAAAAATDMLEGSKGFSKDLCAAAGIPTAAYVRVETEADARIALDRFSIPVVIKADGLAAGKGVTVAMSRAEAEAAIAAAGDGAMVIEEFLEGEEASLFALVDGERAVVLASAQDHKRVGDAGDQGRFRPDYDEVDALVLR